MSRSPLRIELALWLALFAGFSPVIAQFVRFEAWSAPPTALVAPVLIAICLWRESASPAPPRRAGAAFVAAGLLFELFGIALQFWTLAWFGFPVAVIGMALWLGRPSWRIAVLALGLVPIPETIRSAFTPGPESALLSGACAVWRALGVPFSCTGPVARLADRRLELFPDDLGWTLVPLLAQLGWFLAVNERARVSHAVRWTLAMAAGALIVQPLAIVLALGLLAAISEAVARAWLSHGVWLGCTVGALVFDLRRARGRRTGDRPPTRIGVTAWR